MAWDSRRQVPWGRLVRDWLIYAALMSVIFVIFTKDSISIGTFAGLFVSLPVYLLFGGVLAKFGYTRKTLKETRAQSAAKAAARSAAAQQTGGEAVAATRARPAPTKRTGGGQTRSKGRR